MLNQIVVVGRLGKAPEMRYTADGSAVTNFSVATDHGFGEKRETTWHNVVCFGKTAEAVAQYVDKGSVVGVVGRQSHRKYEKDGSTRYFAEIVADRVQFIDTKRADDAAPADQDVSDLPF